MAPKMTQPALRLLTPEEVQESFEATAKAADQMLKEAREKEAKGQSPDEPVVLLKDERLYVGKFPNTLCRVCGKPIEKGESLAWSPHFLPAKRSRHIDCMPKANEQEIEAKKDALRKVCARAYPYLDDYRFMLAIHTWLTQKSPEYKGIIRSTRAKQQ